MKPGRGTPQMHRGMAATASLLVVVCFGLLSTSKAAESGMNQSTVMVHDTAGHTFPLSTTMNMPPILTTTGDLLDPRTVDKYVDSLVLPPPFKQTKLECEEKGKCGDNCDNYQISVRQIEQQVLPPVINGQTIGTTTVFAYGPTESKDNTGYNWPAFTIEAQTKKCTYVQYTNELGCQKSVVDAVDATLHWANPAGGIADRDSNPCMDPSSSKCKDAANAPYSGPVPLVTHLHGSENVGDESDGYAEAWYLSKSCDAPKGYAKEGTWYNIFKEKFERENKGLKWKAGSAISKYPNDQEPTTLWFHDHTVGMTRLNVYSGLAGFYLLRKQSLDKPELKGIPFPPLGADPKKTTSTQLRELPIAMQDRAFYTTGKLYYPVNNISKDATLQGNGPYNPFWVPEFFPLLNDSTTPASVMIVNGKSWPKVAVARSNYRLRLLNGFNSRTVIISFSMDQATVPVPNQIPFWVIGNEAGFLSTPVQRFNLTMGPAERFDIIFDFTSPTLRGKPVYLRNEGPDGPFSNYLALTPPLGETTSQIMRFDVEDTESLDLSFSNGSNLKTDAKIPVQPAASTMRKFALLETRGPVLPDNTSFPLAQYLGEFNATTGEPYILKWDDKVTTNPKPGATEDWEFINLTPDAHPIHIHERYFQIVERKQINVTNTTAAGYTVLGVVPEQPSEVNCFVGKQLCQKDTILVQGSTLTKIRITFPDGKGKGNGRKLLTKDDDKKSGNKNDKKGSDGKKDDKKSGDGDKDDKKGGHDDGDKDDKKSSGGLFVWHCHLLEHEDNEMMRPYCIGQPNYKNPKTGALMCPGPTNP